MVLFKILVGKILASMIFKFFTNYDYFKTWNVFMERLDFLNALENSRASSMLYTVRNNQFSSFSSTSNIVKKN